MSWMIPKPFHGIFSSLGTPAETPAPPRKRDARSSSASSGATADAAASSTVSGVGQLALDIFEHDSYYVLKAPIAGVKLSDLDIEINDNIVTIRGTRKQTDAIPEEHYYLRECYWGSFERSVTLPCAVDPRKVRATFNKENILKIIVPKEERVKIVRIND